MTKIELLRKLLEFGDAMTTEIIIRVVVRDAKGVVISEQTGPLDYIGNFYDKTTLTVNAASLSKLTSTK